MKLFTVVLTLLLFTFSCDNSESESSSSKSKKDTVTNVKPQISDTLPIQPRRPNTDLSPSQARVEGTVINVIRADTGAIANINLKVIEVKGYAKATPPIAESDTLEIRTQNVEDIDEDSRITAIIQYNLSTNTASSQPAWSLVKREN